jgi:small multidrug resistance pump
LNISHLYLIGAIIVEVIATSCLKATEGFTKPLPTAVVIIGYGIAFYLMTLTVRDMPVAIVYAIWSGSGIALITLIAWVLQGQRLDAAALTGIALIVLGVLIMNLFSKSVAH